MVRTLLAAILVLGLGAPAFAQVDLSGTWATRLHEDWMERWPGPDAGDLTGLPINDDGVARAQSYSPSMLSVRERQCLFYGPSYTQIGPFGLVIWAEADPVDGDVVAWKTSGAVDKTPRTIWMDGRPHPSPSAVHTFGGFSTGRWEGATLVVTTTHMKAGPLRRNGAPTSDDAVMTEHLARYGDTLTILSIIDDPAYLEEPYVLSRTYQEDPETVIALYPSPCTPAVEATRSGAGRCAPLSAWREPLRGSDAAIRAARGGGSGWRLDAVPRISPVPGVALHPPRRVWSLLLWLGRRALRAQRGYRSHVGLRERRATALVQGNAATHACRSSRLSGVPSRRHEAPRGGVL